MWVLKISEIQIDAPRLLDNNATAVKDFYTIVELLREKHYMHNVYKYVSMLCR